MNIAGSGMAQSMHERDADSSGDEPPPARGRRISGARLTGGLVPHGYTPGTQQLRKRVTSAVANHWWSGWLTSAFLLDQRQSSGPEPLSGGGCAGSNPAGGTTKRLVSGREPVHVRSLRWSAARLPPPCAHRTTSRPLAGVVTGSWLAAVLGIQSRGVLSATATSSRPGPDGEGRPGPPERSEARAGGAGAG